MNKKIKKGKMDHGTMLPILLGVTISIISMLVGICVCAILIQNEIVPESMRVYCTIATLYISTIAGVIALRKGRAERMLRYSLILGMFYLVVLLMMTALFFEGRYENVITTSIIVFSGCVIPVLLGNNGGKNSKLRRRKI